MSFLHAMTSILGSGGGASDFTPTLYGDAYSRASSSVVSADGEETNKGPANADADTTIWLITSAGEMELRVQADWGGDTGDGTWWDELGVDQGAPDNNRIPGTLIFELGDRTGVTVNIFTTFQNLDSSAVLTKIGTFTDDDGITFFNPTNATDYGWDLDASASDPGDTTVDATQRTRFTFRKAGFNDYVIEFQQEAHATASDES